MEALPGVPASPPFPLWSLRGPNLKYLSETLLAAEPGLEVGASCVTLTSTVQPSFQVGLAYFIVEETEAPDGK